MFGAVTGVESGRLVCAAAVAIGALVPIGCGGKTIDCETNSDCIQGGIPGVCLASPSSSANWCAFQDESCPDTHQRWGNAAGDDLARECVEADVPDGGTDAAPRPDGMVPAISTKIILAAQSQDSLFVYAADTLGS